MPVRSRSCANAHANGVTSRKLTKPQTIKIEEFVAAALKRRADELKKEARRQRLQAEALEATAKQRQCSATPSRAPTSAPSRRHPAPKNSRSGCKSASGRRLTGRRRQHPNNPLTSNAEYDLPRFSLQLTMLITFSWLLWVLVFNFVGSWSARRKWKKELAQEGQG